MFGRSLHFCVPKLQTPKQNSYYRELHSPMIAKIQFGEDVFCLWPNISAPIPIPKLDLGFGSRYQNQVLFEHYFEHKPCSIFVYLTWKPQSKILITENFIRRWFQNSNMEKMFSVCAPISSSFELIQTVEIHPNSSDEPNVGSVTTFLCT